MSNNANTTIFTDNPKQIYNCDFPDCHRSFVRQDLCARHKERHTARGSQLLRKDNFMQNINPIVTAALISQQKPKAPGDATVGGFRSYNGGLGMQSPSVVTNSAHMRSETSTPLDQRQSPVTDGQSQLGRSRADDMVKSEIPRSATFPTPESASSYGPPGSRSATGSDGYTRP